MNTSSNLRVGEVFSTGFDAVKADVLCFIVRDRLRDNGSRVGELLLGTSNNSVMDAAKAGQSSNIVWRMGQNGCNVSIV